MATSDDPVYMIEFTAAVTAAPEDYVAVRPFTIFDAHCVVTTQGDLNGAIILQRQALGAGAFNAATGNIVPSNGAAGAVTRLSDIVVAAQQNFVATDVLRLTEAVEVGAGVFDTFVKVIPTAV